MRIVILFLHQDPVDDSVESKEDKCDAYLSVRIVIPPLHQDPVDDSVESKEDKCDAYLSV